MSASEQIDNYANAMFRHEFLHDAWISACQRYLNNILGENLRGRTVLDYAFGRGNWAVACARCCAERVIAVDASENNCRKLREYCAVNQIKNIEVICGNLVEENINLHCDVLWLYGILHHIACPDKFLERLISKINPKGVVLAYTYNANSLREWVVTVSRSCVLFQNESDFRAHSLWFTPAARMRARDDLVAPCINWDTAATFVSRFARLGWQLAEQLTDFSPWLHGNYSGEFCPYVIKLLKQDSSLIVVEQEDNRGDLTILRVLSELIVNRLPQPLRTSFAIGLFNTHFQNLSHVASRGLVYQTNELVVWENFKYLMYAATALCIGEEDFTPEMTMVWKAAMSSLRGKPEKFQKWTLGDSAILDMLSKTNIRI